MKQLLTGYQFLMLLGSLLSSFLYRYMHRTFYNRKPWAEKHDRLILLCYALIGCIWFGITMLQFPPANLLSTIAAYLIPLYLFHEVKTLRGLAYFAFYLLGIIIMEAVLAAFTGVLHANMGFSTRYDVITPEVSLIMSMFEIILVLSICHFGNKDRDPRLDRATRLFMIMPVCSTLYINAQLLLIGIGVIKDFNESQFMGTAILLVLVNIAIFIILERYTELMKRDFDLAQADMQHKSDADIMELAAKTM